MKTVQGMKRTRKGYSARQKAEAVLAVWTGRRSAAQMSRELGSHGNVLASWEAKALLGMKEALGERPEAKGARPLDLGRRLEKLLAGSGKPKTPEAITTETT